MFKKNFTLILILLSSFSCVNAVTTNSIEKKENSSKPINEGIKPTPILPSFEIPDNISLEDKSFLKKEDYIKYLQCAYDNSKDNTEKEAIKKSIEIAIKTLDEIKFKLDKNFIKECVNDEIISESSKNKNITLKKEDYIKYLQCAYKHSKNDIQKEAIIRNIEIVEKSPDNFKFNANIEFLEECGNL